MKLNKYITITWSCMHTSSIAFTSLAKFLIELDRTLPAYALSTDQGKVMLMSFKNLKAYSFHIICV